MGVAMLNTRNKYNAIDIKTISAYSIGGGNSRVMEKKRSNIPRAKVVSKQDSVVIPSCSTDTPSGVRPMHVGLGFCVNDDMVYVVGYNHSGLCAGVVRHDTAIEFFSHWV
jgi:hypothetical protein